MLFHILAFWNLVSYLSLLAFNALILSSFGRQIVQSHGTRTLWLLYLGGAISGGFCMQLFKPYNSIVIPEVGAGPAVSSVITFYGMLNLQKPIMFFIFPMKMWVVLAIMGFFAFADPSKKNVGGMMTGFAMALIFKRKF